MRDALGHLQHETEVLWCLLGPPGDGAGLGERVERRVALHGVEGVCVLPEEPVLRGTQRVQRADPRLERPHRATDPERRCRMFGRLHPPMMPLGAPERQNARRE